MSYRGTTSRRAKSVEYPFDPSHGESWWRAGAALRRQAIQRTLEESIAPHRVWGIEGKVMELRVHANNGTSFTAESLSEETMPRLSLLRAVDI